MEKARKWSVTATVALIGLLLLLGIVSFFAAETIPDQFTVTAGDSLDLSSRGFSTGRVAQGETAQVSAQSGDNTYQALVRLGGIIPIKTVSVTETEPVSAVVGGTPFGVKLFTNGVMVVGLSAISTADGSQSPAEAAGVQLGDVITQIDGVPVTETTQVGAAMEASDGAPVILTIDRDGVSQTVTVTPVCSDFDGKYKGGVWVRDSTAGIGIVTFYRPETGVFAGLGHGICDVDTNGLMPLRTGEIVPVTISGVVKGQAGNAGALKGYFTDDDAIGHLYQNSDSGVYGTLTGGLAGGETMEIARKQEVETGPAQILTTVDGQGPKLYDIEIESLDLRDTSQVKNMVVHITDPALLEKTGGIVQGMSGSPILQNGKLVGAVTHVFLNDPKRGYGIFGEHMAAVADNLAETISELPNSA